MAKRTYSEARRDYWTECWFPPTIEELKSDGRWERLSQEVQEEYLELDRYRLENQDKIAKWKAVLTRAEQMMAKNITKPE